jgi:hypothetical protein
MEEDEPGRVGALLELDADARQIGHIYRFGEGQDV